MKKSTYWLGLAAALSVLPAGAANREIRAMFRPDPAQPNKNEFINTTPNSGYCTIYPDQCAQQNMFSIQHSAFSFRFVSNQFVPFAFMKAFR